MLSQSKCFHVCGCNIVYDWLFFCWSQQMSLSFVTHGWGVTTNLNGYWFLTLFPSTVRLFISLETCIGYATFHSGWDRLHWISPVQPWHVKTASQRLGRHCLWIICSHSETALLCSQCPWSLWQQQCEWMTFKETSCYLVVWTDHYWNAALLMLNNCNSNIL